MQKRRTLRAPFSLAAMAVCGMLLGGCGDGHDAITPFDWARGFVMSSWSDGSYGVGMEIPFAAENYATVTLEIDKNKRLELNEAFVNDGIDSALCIGIVGRPQGTMQNPDLIAEYEKLPMINGIFGQMSNLESLVLR